MAESTGSYDLRKEFISPVVTGFALQEYVMKQLVATTSTDANKETYWEETAADLTGHSVGSTFKGVPRLANFPYAQVTWTKRSKVNLKHASEAQLSYEDIKTNDIDMVARTLLRIARGVTKSVDTEIWNALTEDQTAVRINSVSIAAGSEWDSTTIANRNPINNILSAIQAIQENNYNPYQDGFLVLSPKDFKNVIDNDKVSRNPTFKTDIVSNGKVGDILGLKIIVSNSVTADYAAVVVAKECGTWRQVAPLEVVTIDDPGIKLTIRAWEYGSCLLTNAKAVCLIDNTQA